MKVKYRVKDKQEFQDIYKKGIRLNFEFVKARYLANKLSYSRVGISVPTKCGNAVIRNKIKRQIRAVLAHKMNFTQPIDIIIVATTNYSVMNFEKVNADLTELLKKVGNIS